MPRMISPPREWNALRDFEERIIHKRTTNADIRARGRSDAIRGLYELVLERREPRWTVERAENLLGTSTRFLKRHPEAIAVIGHRCQQVVCIADPGQCCPRDGVADVPAQ